MHPRANGHLLDLRPPSAQYFFRENNRDADPWESDSLPDIPTPGGHSRATGLDTTVVVPTFNERHNVRPLVERLCDALQGRAAEILFVDDSTDDTPGEIARVAANAPLPVRMIHREGSERAGGLSGAVTAGVLASDSAFVVVMHGDLQHPPQLTPVLRDAAQDADVAVASRYVGGGKPSGFSSRYRRFLSSASTVVARACFPRRVGRICSDPMAGFFCFRRSAVDVTRLHPRGSKILVEILARHDLRVREVPFTFGKRMTGASKANSRTGVEFVRQMAHLRMGRMSRFAAVGALGAVVNLAVMALLVHAQAAHYVTASLVAAEISMLFNFGMQERFVFRDLRGGLTLRRLGQHLLFNNAEALARLPLLVLLVQGLLLPSVVAQAVSLGIAFSLRFLFMSRVVYRTPKPLGQAASPGSLRLGARKTSDLLDGVRATWAFPAMCAAVIGVVSTSSSQLVQRYWAPSLAIPLLILLVEPALVRRITGHAPTFGTADPSPWYGLTGERAALHPFPTRTVKGAVAALGAYSVLIALSPTETGPLAGRAFASVAAVAPLALSWSAGVVVISLLLTGMSVLTLYLNVDSKRTPEAAGAAEFPKAGPPRHGFSIAVPARHEEAVLAHTLDRLLTQTHPRFEILPIVSRDDPVTAAIATGYQSRYPHKVKVVWDRTPTELKNKPRAMNESRGRCDPTLDFYVIVDAESDVAPDLLRHIDTVVQQRDADVVIGGVQLMDFYKSWWAPINCVEYYTWFSSRLHYQSRADMTPYSGNSLAVRKAMLDAHGWYDPTCLAEDCDLGVRLSAEGAKTVVAYSPALATKEETPRDVGAWLKQRIRWHQGFLQVLLKRDWMRLPTRRQRALALFTLGSAFTQAATGLAMLLAVATVLLLEVPDWVALLTFLPLVPGFLFLGVQAMALHDLYDSFKPYYAEIYAAQQSSNRELRKVSSLRRVAVGARFHLAGLLVAAIRATGTKRNPSRRRNALTPEHLTDRGHSWRERKQARLEAVRGSIRLDWSGWQIPRSRMARLTWRHYAAVVLSPLTYQPLLSVAGVTAAVRQRRGNLSWAKTEHRNAHREDTKVPTPSPTGRLRQTAWSHLPPPRRANS